MDTRQNLGSTHTIIVSGAGHCALPRDDGFPFPLEVDEVLDVGPYLRYPKMKKFMGKQDQMAVIAAARAVAHAGLDAGFLANRTGIYLTVGYIPFDQDEIESLTQHSSENGQFNMTRFAQDGLAYTNPLLTFRCLPNMPAFHVSHNLGVQGPYWVNYPDGGQFYGALEEAIVALSNGDIDVALLGAVADQNNFLVKHQLRRLGVSETPCDTAGFLVLERAGERREFPGFAQLSQWSIAYTPPDREGAVHYEQARSQQWRWHLHQNVLGPASLVLTLSSLVHSATPNELSHEINTQSGFIGRSQWTVHEYQA